MPSNYTLCFNTSDRKLPVYDSANDENRQIGTIYPNELCSHLWREDSIYTTSRRIAFIDPYGTYNYGWLHSPWIPIIEAYEAYMAFFSMGSNEHVFRVRHRTRIFDNNGKYITRVYAGDEVTVDGLSRCGTSYGNEHLLDITGYIKDGTFHSGNFYCDTDIEIGYSRTWNTCIYGDWG